VRYGSDPRVLQGNLLFSRREGNRSTELTLGGAAPLADATTSPFSIPLASFTVRTPDREITLLDRVITNSPLTVSRSNVRGLHLREGPWRLHAGYSHFGSFEESGSTLAAASCRTSITLVLRHNVAGAERSARCSTRHAR
jgi:hypothetical protein